MRLGKTVLYHFGSQVVVSLAGFLVTLLIAFLVGQEGLGLYSVAVGHFLLAVPASKIGRAVTKRMSKGELASEYFTGGVILNRILAKLLSGASVLGMLRVLEAEFVRMITTYDVEIATLISI